MINLILKIIKKNRKPLIWTFTIFVLSIVSLLYTFNSSYYFFLLSIPFTTLTIYFIPMIFKNLKESYGYIKLNDFYENGQLKYKIQKNIFNKKTQYNLYNQNGNLIGKSFYSSGVYLNKCWEYFDFNNIRMIQENSNFKFYDENSILRCEIFIESEEIIDKNEYKESISYFWYRDDWKSGLRLLYKPHGIWKEYNSDGNIKLELNFKNYDSKTNINNCITKNIYNSSGNLIASDLVYPQKLFIESFDQRFTFERLVDKKAKYRTGSGPTNWYAEFEIPPILSIENILETIPKSD